MGLKTTAGVLGGAAAGGMYLKHRFGNQDDSLTDQAEGGVILGLSGAALGYTGYKASQLPGMKDVAQHYGGKAWDGAKSVASGTFRRPMHTVPTKTRAMVNKFIPSRPGKGSLFVAAASVAAFAIGSKMSPNHGSEIAGVENESGDVDYMSREDANSRKPSGVRNRMNNIGASGDLVFGAHSGRHR